MKKILIALLTIALLSGCSGTKTKNPKITHKKKTSATTKRVASKYSDYIRPSESMQAGIAKKEKYSLAKNDNEAAENNTSEQSEDEQNAQYEGIFKVGNPYEVFGVNYVPQNYEDYEEIGTASWYGDDFHGKRTANGETYNMGSMTAAHPTLPLPSLVRVTNLRNNKAVIVRVNDRGPFSKNRVIDVSEKAATLLGFKQHGTTEVKVELLREETNQLLEKLKIKN